jgi:hypothetical protein
MKLCIERDRFHSSAQTSFGDMTLGNRKMKFPIENSLMDVVSLPIHYMQKRADPYRFGLFMLVSK